MKITIGILLIFSSYCNACNEKETNNSATQVIKEQSDSLSSKEGIVKKITYGKDGYEAEIETSSGSIITAIISRANLKDSKIYTVFKEKDKVKITGELWKLGEQERMTVRRFTVMESVK